MELSGLFKLGAYAERKGCAEQLIDMNIDFHNMSLEEAKKVVDKYAKGQREKREPED